MEITEELYIKKLYEITGDVYSGLAISSLKNFFTSLGELYEADADNSDISGFGPKKSDLLKEFQTKLKNNRKHYLKVHQAIQPIVIDVPDGSFANKLLPTLIEIKKYYLLQEWLNVQLGNAVLSISSSQVLDKYFAVNADKRWFSNSKIAEEHNCTIENVDNFRLNRMKHGEILSGQSDNVKLNFKGTTFVEDLAKLKYTSKIRTALDPDGLLDNELLDRYAEIFGYSIANFHLYSKDDDIIERYFLTAKKETGEFRENLRILIKIAKDKVLAMSEEKIIEDVKIAWKKSKIKVNEEALKAIINGSDIFQKDDKNEKPEYYTKWMLLTDNKVRVARILLDENRAMLKSEIFKKYNSLCSLNDISGLKEENQVRTIHSNVISLGNNLWVFGEDTDAVNSVVNAIEEYAIKNGPFVFNEMFTFLKNDYPQYDERTIRSYTTMRANCRPIIQSYTFDYMHESLLMDYPNIKVAQRQNVGMGYKIIQAILNVLSQSDQEVTFEYLRSKVIDLIKQESGDQFQKDYFKQLLGKLVTEEYVLKQNENYLSNIKDLNEKEIQSIGKAKEPTYRTAIKDRTVQILKARNNEPILLTELRPQVIDLYPKDMTINNWYKIFNDQELFFRANEGTRAIVSLNLNLLPIPVHAEEEALEIGAAISQEFLEEVQAQSKEDFDINVLFKQILKVLKEDYNMGDSQAQKGLNVLKSFYGNNQNNNNPRYVLFKGLHIVWNLQTDIYDRRVCIDKLAMSYESFLKTLIWKRDEKIGLGRLLDQDDMTRMLKNYHKNYRDMMPREVNSLMKKMSLALKKLKAMADALRHNDEEETVQVNYHEGNLMQNIKDFVALYVYTGSIV